jgi:uncharacterized protein
MRYTWDPAKDALNRRKHGLSLADGIDALEDPEQNSWVDDRFDYGEVRIVTLGMNRNRVLFAVSTERDKNWTRIISVRKAEKHEIRQYDLGRA